MIHIQGLGYIGCHAAFGGLFPGVLKDIRGHGDDRNRTGVAAVQGADGAGSIKSVHKGHLDIHQNGTVEARGRSGEHFQRALSIGSDIRRYADPVQHALDDFLIDQVIFGDQYTQALQTGIIRFVCCDVWRGIIHFGTAAGRQRQRDTEGRSDIYRTVYFNGTSHHLGKGVTNGQPQAGPDPVFGRIPVFLGKRRKEAGHEIRMDTAAGIRYGKYGKGDFSRRGRKDGSGQGDPPSGICELNGIVQQIDQDLLHPYLVTEDAAAVFFNTGAVQDQLDLFRVRKGPYDHGNRVIDVADGGFLRIQLIVAGFDLIDLQDLIDNTEQILAGGLDLIQIGSGAGDSRDFSRSLLSFSIFRSRS